MRASRCKEESVFSVMVPGVQLSLRALPALWANTALAMDCFLVLWQKQEAHLK